MFELWRIFRSPRVDSLWHSLLIHLQAFSTNNGYRNIDRLPPLNPGFHILICRSFNVLLCYKLTHDALIKNSFFPLISFFLHLPAPHPPTPTPSRGFASQAEEILCGLFQNNSKIWQSLNEYIITKSCTCFSIGAAKSTDDYERFQMFIIQNDLHL